jgi:hypothetical protein
MVVAPMRLYQRLRARLHEQAVQRFGDLLRRAVDRGGIVAGSEPDAATMLGTLYVRFWPGCWHPDRTGDPSPASSSICWFAA